MGQGSDLIPTPAWHIVGSFSPKIKENRFNISHKGFALALFPSYFPNYPLLPPIPMHPIPQFPDLVCLLVASVPAKITHCSLSLSQPSPLGNDIDHQGLPALPHPNGKYTCLLGTDGCLALFFPVMCQVFPKMHLFDLQGS